MLGYCIVSVTSGSRRECLVLCEIVQFDDVAAAGVSIERP